MSENPEGLAITRAKLDDVGILVDLVTRQLTEHDIKLTVEQVANAIRPALADPEKGLFLVAWREQSRVGFAYLALVWSLEHAGRAAWLEELYVLPAHRERGVGAALLRAALGEARAHGCAAVDLEVDETHRRAEHLYYRNGFLRLTRTRWVKRLDASSAESGRALHS